MNDTRAEHERMHDGPRMDDMHVCISGARTNVGSCTKLGTNEVGVCMHNLGTNK
ncbi:hypothetical protein PaelaDRAFT_6073 [Paenibacillus lactis 154]|uniref:Uncharacterized protein n=1 Tax=Paenibacillus lactis 154 TaxID=743719 RepID=G4HQ12_9BACL|nr:hypothetical protein PaelaDRAFT_6073 [Paenibacillus lactis 154]